MAHASSGGGFSRNGLVCWLWGSSQADGCHCNPGNPPQWKRVTKLSSCVLTLMHTTRCQCCPGCLAGVFRFPMKGAASREKALVGGWSCAGHGVPAAAVGIGSCFPCSSSHPVLAACSTGCSSPRAFWEWMAAVSKGSGSVARLGQLQLRAAQQVPLACEGCAPRACAVYVATHPC